MVETIESQLTQQQREELSELQETHQVIRARIKNILKTVQLTSLPDFADEGGPDILLDEMVPAEALDFNLHHHRLENPTCVCDSCTDFYESNAREI